MLGKCHRTSKAAYEQRSALPNRVMPAATRLTEFAAVSDLACRCDNSRHTMGERHHNRERLHCPVAK